MFSKVVGREALEKISPTKEKVCSLLASTPTFNNQKSAYSNEVPQ